MEIRGCLWIFVKIADIVDVVDIMDIVDTVDMVATVNIFSWIS